MLQLLLFEATGEDKYKQAVVGTLTDWLPGGSIQYTPQGLAWRLQWAPLRYACESLLVKACLDRLVGQSVDYLCAWLAGWLTMADPLFYACELLIKVSASWLVGYLLTCLDENVEQPFVLCL